MTLLQKNDVDWTEGWAKNEEGKPGAADAAASFLSVVCDVRLLLRACASLTRLRWRLSHRGWWNEEIRRDVTRCSNCTFGTRQMSDESYR
jgi:hypothetical protein